jgi:hypothetical protein
MRHWWMLKTLAYPELSTPARFQMVTGIDRVSEHLYVVLEVGLA